MRNSFMIAMLIGFQASAINCDTDAECFSKAISLIKKATKLDACRPDALEVARHVEWQSAATVQDKAEVLEECLYQAGKKVKLEKQHAKRIERIKKALGKS